MLTPLQINFSFYLLSTESKLKYLLQCNHKSLGFIQFCLRPEQQKALYCLQTRKIVSAACFENTDHRSEHPRLSPKSNSELKTKTQL